VEQGVDAVAVLVENQRAFVRFVEKKLGDRALAEDVVQEAFVRSADKVATLGDEESVIAWFYRVLKNAVVDQYRRRAAKDRKLEAFAAELEAEGGPDAELQGTVCQCVSRLSGTLKAEYAEALQRVEIDGISVKEYAAEVGITSNNAAVRVFRAREALRKQVIRCCGACAKHGCVDCTCHG